VLLDESRDVKESALLPVNATAVDAVVPWWPLRTILVPVDFTAGSFEALQFAATLGRECHAAIIVLHVVQLNLVGEELGCPRTQYLNEMAEQARSQLRRWTEMVFTGPSAVRIVIAEGRPHQEILQQARERGADLMVISAHRYGGLLKLLRFLHPNTVAHIVAEACCPVLVVSTNKRGISDGD
jgi:nucleotide-binding universal stress UspA family protein